MTQHELLMLVDYHYWARDRMLDAVAALSQAAYIEPRGSSFGSIRDTLVHTYGAERIWLARWHGHSPSAGPDIGQLPDLAALRAAWASLESDVRAYAQGLEGERVNERVRYRNMKGVEAESSRWTMLQHVVNHASYHRGQVTTMVRQAGGTIGASQDLITYYREHGI